MPLAPLASILGRDVGVDNECIKVSSPRDVISALPVVGADFSRCWMFTGVRTPVASKQNYLPDQFRAKKYTLEVWDSTNAA